MKTFIAGSRTYSSPRTIVRGSGCFTSVAPTFAFAVSARATVESHSRCNGSRTGCNRNHFCEAPCGPTRRPVSIQAVMARSLTPTAVKGQDAGTTRSPEALPDRLRDVEHLEEVMTTPSAALIGALQELPGDIIILGVGGKIGPTLARLAKRAAPGKRVVGVARFSETGLREKLAGWAIECVEADLLERKQIEALPKLANVVFMAGRQFGSFGPGAPMP